MAAPQLHPDAAHLSVGIYCDALPEPEAFARLCRTIESRGGVPNGILEVFPEGLDFDWVSDLASVAQEIETPIDRFRELVEGKVHGTSVVKAGFTADPVGLVVSSYELRRAGEDARHPIAAIMYSGPLGIPMELWSSQDRLEAKEIGDWACGLLQDVCEEIDPLYGMVAIEETLPTPAGLKELRSRDIFISDRVLAADQMLDRDLRSFYGKDRVSRWTTGIFCYGWSALYIDRSFLEDIPSNNAWVSRRLSEAVHRAGF